MSPSWISSRPFSLLCVLLLAFVALAGCSTAADTGQAAAPAAKIDLAKSGVYESGPWRYEGTVTAPGSKSAGFRGKLFYQGVALSDPGDLNNYYDTPWGPMYWVGDPQVLWGAHGWIPMTKSPESAGKALPLPSKPASATLATPAVKIELSKDGVYQSGLWRYEYSVSTPGFKSEGYHGKLLYNGAVMPEPANINDYYSTPWGPIYWVGLPPIPWGDHGWMPHTRLREAAGKALAAPTFEDKLVVCAEVLAPGALATPDRLENTAWVVADLKKFGVQKGHVQQDWHCLSKTPVTIHDTKRWGTAQMRLADTASGKPLAVEVIGRGTLLLAPVPQGTSAAATPPALPPKATQTVELPKQAGATRLVKYTLTGLPFDEPLDLYLAMRVESLGRILVVGPEANGKTVTVNDMDTIMIRLPGEDPNKAAWVVTSVKGKTVAPLGPVAFEGDTANPFGVVLNGTFNALFHIQQKGRATVAMEYRPVTEENKPAAQTFKVELDVQSVAAVQKPQR